jgi:sugar phosphate isomerase/epimerase
MADRWATGIFTSIEGGLGASLDSASELGVSTVHLHAPVAAHRTPKRIEEIKASFVSAGIEITVVFVGFEDDDYTTMALAEETVGLTPSGRRDRRLAETLAIADFAAALGVDAIGMHLGFIPPDQTSRTFSDLVGICRKVCDHCGSNEQHFHLETGQESADTLFGFIDAVERDNLAVNFDPANMILYGSGEPLEALDKIGTYVRSVHCKDASRTRKEGQPWYEDAPLGDGDVNIEAFLRKLHGVGYEGALTIEREYSPDQAGDIEASLRLLEQLRSKIQG